MPIFPPPGPTPESTSLVVDAAPLAVYVSKLTTGGTSPEWGEWAIEPRLTPTEVFRGSSVAGMSRASLRFHPPAADNMSVESAPGILTVGDRVSIAILDGPDGAPRFIWAGFCVRVGLNISETAEHASWGLLGPEWWWGADGAGTGASAAIYGQARRTEAGDESFLSGGYAGNVTPYDAWDFNFAPPTVFNPQGRKNMTDRDIELDEDSPPTLGRIFDEPDRRTGGSSFTRHWTLLEALKYVVTLYSGAPSGITPPADWGAIAVPSTAVLRSTSVEGLGIWSAMRAICGADYGFFVDPTPAGGNPWGGFQLTFCSRAASLGGGTASLHMAPRLTAPSDALACVARLNATKDASKVVNSIRVLGRRLVHVCLRYHGGQTPTMAMDKRPLSLQHGWLASEGDAKTYWSSDTKTLTMETIDKAGKTAEWVDRYTTAGKDFPHYRHVFRLFTWNESREWYNPAGKAAPELPLYYRKGTDQSLAWYGPAMPTAIANGGRRRRRFLDTIYRDVEVDEYRRVRPCVFIAYNTATDPDVDTTLTAWKRLPASTYQIDDERGAVWFTKQDLASWYPFVDQAAPDGTDTDDLNFMTLLVTGRLRIAVECCVEGGEPVLAAKSYDASSDLKLDRRAVIRRDRDFTAISTYNDGQGFILAGMPTNTIDDTADADKFAAAEQEAGRDVQCHASVLVEADWPQQEMGKFIGTISGRAINLSTGTGRSAQIVAATLDLEALRWEYLTESSALAVKGGRKGALTRTAKVIKPWEFRDAMGYAEEEE